MLARRGAVIVDTDHIAREVVEPGTPAYQAVVDRFGPQVVRADGSLDRKALADLVFEDPEALAALNRIVHPAVRAVVAERVAAEAATDHVVVLVVPLLVESGGAYDVAGVIVVDCAQEVAVTRLVGRGMDEADARRRLAAQTTRARRLANADFVIVNDGSLEDLEAEVDAAWTWITGLRLRAGVAQGGRDAPS
jgi:dephospho-CoA kinase